MAIDESPIKVGVERAKHKMRQGYVWPIFGEHQEVVFKYYASRGAMVLSELLSDFKGVLLSDGFSAYKSYMKSVEANQVQHATCWTHARRKFVELENICPEQSSKALEIIAELYKIESGLGSKSNKSSELLFGRMTRSSQVVDRYFDWLKSFNGKSILATNSKLRLAIGYSLEREESMRVFLKNPDVSLDTNHVEREIRPIAIGRKNWLFCWSELGADSLCNAQSLIRTCLLQGVNPRDYLVDVLQRLTLDKPDDLTTLLPRFWKENFAEKPKPCPSTSITQVNL